MRLNAKRSWLAHQYHNEKRKKKYIKKDEIRDSTYII